MALSQPHHDTAEVLISMHCTCGKWFKEKSTYNQIDKAKLVDLRQRVLTHTSSGAKHQKPMSWADIDLPEVAEQGKQAALEEQRTKECAEASKKAADDRCCKEKGSRIKKKKSGSQTTCQMRNTA